MSKIKSVKLQQYSTDGKLKLCTAKTNI